VTIKVTPGPLPDDGTRIKVDPTLDAFVNGTTLENFGPEDFAGASEISFMVSATDAPATDARIPNMLWFRRGEGVTYTWDLQVGLWLAMSNRKEMAVRLQGGPAKLGSVVWMDVGGGDGQFTEYHGVQLGNNRMVLKAAATEMESTVASLRNFPTPPFFLCTSDVALTFNVTSFSGVGDGVYQSVVELGYYPAQVKGMDVSEGPAHGVLQASNPSDAWWMAQTPYAATNSMGAHIVGSGPPSGDGTLLVFLKSTPASLCF
jgi:hypothetical protein